mgnify:FL=1
MNTNTQIVDPSTFFSGARRSMDIKQSSESIGHFVEKTFDNILTRPTYQRGFNWNEVKVSNFIMTIMMCGYVQPLLLYRYHEDDVIEDKKFEIIDGQQRAASIKAFMKGEPIIGKKHKQIMAYVKKDGYYMFYNKTKIKTVMFLHMINLS